MTGKGHAARVRVGWWVFAGLAALTGFEFVISASVPSAFPYLAVTALVKAGLIVVYFMHVTQLWKRGGPTQ